MRRLESLSRVQEELKADANEVEETRAVVKSRSARILRGNKGKKVKVEEVPFIPFASPSLAITVRYTESKRK